MDVRSADIRIRVQGACSKTTGSYVHMSQRYEIKMKKGRKKHQRTSSIFISNKRKHKLGPNTWVCLDGNWSVYSNFRNFDMLISHLLVRRTKISLNKKYSWIGLLCSQKFLVQPTSQATLRRKPLIQWFQIWLIIVSPSALCCYQIAPFHFTVWDRLLFLRKKKTNAIGLLLSATATSARTLPSLPMDSAMKFNTSNLSCE